MMESADILLKTVGLSKLFGGLTAVKGVDFQLEKGEVRAIIGPNGAGKSTFFNLLTGHLRPSGGRIYFEGKDITNLRPHQVSRIGIARSFQITNIFLGLTVFENIRIACQSRRVHYNLLSHFRTYRSLEEQAMQILESVRLREKAGMISSQLSHGEQRHLEMGVALATHPTLLLLDEPTAGMSKGEASGIIELVQNISRDLSVILVEHDMKVVMELATTITVLHQGEIIAEGPPQEIQGHSRVQEVYLGYERDT